MTNSAELNMDNGANASQILKHVESLTNGFVNSTNLSDLWYEIIELSGKKKCGIECECSICDIRLINELIASVYVGALLEVYFSADRDYRSVVTVVVDKQYYIEKFVSDSWFDVGEIYISKIVQFAD